MTHHADVGKSEGASTEVCKAQLVCTGQLVESLQLNGHFQYTEARHILDVGHHEALRAVYGYSDVVRALRKKVVKEKRNKNAT